MANNKFLLDTHIFIWAMEENNRLSTDIKQLLTNPRNRIFISVASFWEIIIKYTKTPSQKEKFILDLNNIESSTKVAGFEVLPIVAANVFGLTNLPPYHKDPFDRILISQAKTENLTFITLDKKIHKYDVSLLKI